VVPDSVSLLELLLPGRPVEDGISGHVVGDAIPIPVSAARLSAKPSISE
jgi:hypothetical protein